MSDLLDRGAAMGPPAEVADQGAPARLTSFPVFYDKTGKRLRRVVCSAVLGVVVVLCVVAVAAAWFLPAAIHSVRNTNSDSTFARQRLQENANATMLPMVGDGPLSRMVKVVREHTGTGAIPGPDPALLQPVPVPDDDGDGIPDDVDGNGVPDAPQPPPELPEPPPVSPVKLFDAVTGNYVRDAKPWEINEIGDNEYAVDAYAHIPDKTLILTFDDGPDAIWTPKILDILAREHVPAVFFLIGERVVKNPEIVQRILREGHEIGNHSLTHPDLQNLPDTQRQEELVVTDHIIRATADYATPFFRIPMGAPNGNPLAQLHAQQLGYLQINSSAGFTTLDTHDWEHAGPGDKVPMPVLDGRGYVVTMHDAGGHTRLNTETFLPKLIAQAKAQGYMFAPVSSLYPPDQRPQKDIRPTLVDRATLFIAQIRYVTFHESVWWLVMLIFVAVTIATVLNMTLSILNEWRQRRRVWPDLPDDEWPFVSVALAAYNEEKVIARTLAVLRDSDYPADRFEVVAVNDGSTDHTLQMLLDAERGWNRLRVINQPNSGKSSALNNAARHADPRATVIITMDADTLFRRSTVRNLARHFIRPQHNSRPVGVVSGHVKVGNRRNILTAWQSLEYLQGIGVIRMAEMMMGIICVVPGACSAWRRELLDQIGGFRCDTLAEDADAAMAAQKLRYRVLHDNHAICDTEAPESLPALLKQRKRWMFGNYQVLWKTRSMLFRPRYGVLGMIAMPLAVGQLFVNLCFMPLILYISVMVAVQGVQANAYIGIAVLVGMHLLTPVTAVVLAREKLWHLAVIPIYRPIFEILRLYLLYSCAYRVIKGAEFSWDKLERRNTVLAAETAPTHERKDQNDEPTTNGHAVVLSGTGGDRLWADDESVKLRSAELIGGYPSRV